MRFSSGTSANEGYFHIRDIISHGSFLDGFFAPPSIHNFSEGNACSCCETISYKVERLLDRYAQHLDVI